MNISYVTYDQSGALTGGYLQPLAEEHSANHIEVDDETRLAWPLYAANEERDAVEMAAIDQNVMRLAMWERIKGERDRRKALGVKVGLHWFHSDDSSRIQQLGLVMMGASMPAGVQWKTLDGTFTPMTPVLAGQILSATGANDQAIFDRAEQHRLAIEAAAEPSAYDFSSGWPIAFGDLP